MKIVLPPPRYNEKLDEYSYSTAVPALQDLFSHDLNRSINPVVKADDEDNLLVELREYVITEEIGLQLSAFLELYNDYDSAKGNGVWISGFFGSGKSHLLKMLALVLENRIFDDGYSALELFLENNESIDAELKAQLKKAISTYPCENLLFNIDVKTNKAGEKTSEDAVLGAFMRVLNEHRGFEPTNQYVAAFESDLSDDDKYELFKEVYFNSYGRNWVEDRVRAMLIESKVSSVLAQVYGDTPDDHKNTLGKYKDSYSLTPEDFAKKVHEYIVSKRAEKGKNFRLNFLVDELGQYVAGRPQLMLNLQTISENITSICGENSWLIVTAQESMDVVIGQDEQSKHGLDFSKIQDRFQTHIKLSSKNVEEVISKRLLEKNERAKLDLSTIYADKKDNFKTLFDFTSGSYEFRHFRNENDFIAIYPFIPYQFGLFQECIKNLSASGAFEGYYRSVGERSMLGVFHLAIQKLEKQSLGRIASFDLLYDGIAKSLKTSIKGSLENAERDLPEIRSDDPQVVGTAIRLLKILLLVRYCKSFKSTLDNLTVLLQTSFDNDLRALKRNVGEALELLVRQSYVTQDGPVYLYLTDEQKALEERINNVEIETREINEALSDMLFGEALELGSAKIRDAQYNVDYPFTRMINGEKAGGKSFDLGIDFFIPGLFDERYTADDLGNKYQKERQLVVVLAENDSLLSDVIRYLKTDKYIRRNNEESASNLINVKQEQNQHQKDMIKVSLQDCIANASFYVGGVRVNGTGKNVKALVSDAFVSLIEQVYNKRKLTRGLNCVETDIREYLTEPILFADQTAANEVMTFVNRSKQTGKLCTVASIVDEFQKIPYGWKYENILCVLASLFPIGKIEFESAGGMRVSDLREIELKLKNTREQKSLQILPVKLVDVQLIRKIRDFAKEYFSGESFPAEVEQLRARVAESFKIRAQSINNWLNDAHSEAWPLSLEDQDAMQQVIDEAKLLGKDDRLVFETLSAKLDALKDNWTQHLSKLSSFVNNKLQRNLFSSSKKLLEDLGGRHVEELLEGTTPLLKEKIYALQQSLLDPAFYDSIKLRTLNNVSKDLLNYVLSENNKLYEDLQSKFERSRTDIESGKEYLSLDEEGKQHIASFFAQKESRIKNIDPAQSESYSKLLKLTQKFDDELYNGAYELLAKEETRQYSQSTVANTTEDPALPTEDKVQTQPKPQIRICKLGELIEEKFGTTPPLSTTQDVEKFVAKLQATLDEAVACNVRVILK